MHRHHGNLLSLLNGLASLRILIISFASLFKSFCAFPVGRSGKASVEKLSY